ncbi:unnamed protein product [Phytophthora fragariaefolia]|uniref:Unnamed protein product n=1 Tax=Phytophthora fragariaefolia TaxID=1490495 RepID=A0A9W6XJZ9_9STRA|nr:unnamed protein product [Phytophthora fragariaefolia]
MIEDQGFIDFVLYITRVLGHVNVPLPKRTQLRGCIIALAAELREHVKKEINTGCEYFSVTADIWTGRNGHSYISFTIYYVDDEFYPRNWTLEVKEISGRHSGELIAGFLDDIMGDWELNKERCPRLVRDLGANMVSCGNILGLEHVSCLAHDIHLVLSGAMSKDKNTSSTEKGSPLLQLVAVEPGSVKTDNEEDESLSEEERAEMNRLRSAAIQKMDEFLENTLSNLQKGDMEMVRETVQRFR